MSSARAGDLQVICSKGQKCAIEPDLKKALESGGSSWALAEMERARTQAEQLMANYVSAVRSGVLSPEQHQTVVACLKDPRHLSGCVDDAGVTLPPGVDGTLNHLARWYTRAGLVASVLHQNKKYDQKGFVAWKIKLTGQAASTRPGKYAGGDIEIDAKAAGPENSQGQVHGGGGAKDGDARSRFAEGGKGTIDGTPDGIENPREKKWWELTTQSQSPVKEPILCREIAQADCLPGDATLPSAKIEKLAVDIAKTTELEKKFAWYQLGTVLDYYAVGAMEHVTAKGEGAKQFKALLRKAADACKPRDDSAEEFKQAIREWADGFPDPFSDPETADSFGKEKAVADVSTRAFAREVAQAAAEVELLKQDFDSERIPWSSELAKKTPTAVKVTPIIGSVYNLVEKSSNVADAATQGLRAERNRPCGLHGVQAELDPEIENYYRSKGWYPDSKAPNSRSNLCKLKEAQLSRAMRKLEQLCAQDAVLCEKRPGEERRLYEEMVLASTDAGAMKVYRKALDAADDDDREDGERIGLSAARRYIEAICSDPEKMGRMGIQDATVSAQYFSCEGDAELPVSGKNAADVRLKKPEAARACVERRQEAALACAIRAQSERQLTAGEIGGTALDAGATAADIFLVGAIFRAGAQGTVEVGRQAGLKAFASRTLSREAVRSMWKNRLAAFKAHGGKIVIAGSVGVGLAVGLTETARRGAQDQVDHAQGKVARREGEAARAQRDTAAETLRELTSTRDKAAALALVVAGFSGKAKAPTFAFAHQKLPKPPRGSFFGKDGRLWVPAKETDPQIQKGQAIHGNYRIHKKRLYRVANLDEFEGGPRSAPEPMKPMARLLEEFADPATHTPDVPPARGASDGPAAKALADVERFRGKGGLSIYEHFVRRDINPIPRHFHERALDPPGEVLGLDRDPSGRPRSFGVRTSSGFHPMVAFQKWLVGGKAKRPEKSLGAYKVYLGVPPERIAEIARIAVEKGEKAYQFKFCYPQRCGRKDRMIFYFSDPKEAIEFARRMDFELQKEGVPPGQAPRLGGRLGSGRVALGYDLLQGGSHSRRVADAISTAAKNCTKGDIGCIHEVFQNRYGIDPDTYLPLSIKDELARQDELVARTDHQFAAGMRRLKDVHGNRPTLVRTLAAIWKSADLEKREAIWRAHEIGLDGPPGKKFTMEELAQKTNILKGAGFTQQEREALILSGTTGSSDRVNAATLATVRVDPPRKDSVAPADRPTVKPKRRDSPGRYSFSGREVSSEYEDMLAGLRSKPNLKRRDSVPDLDKMGDYGQAMKERISSPEIRLPPELFSTEAVPRWQSIKPPSSRPNVSVRPDRPPSKIYARPGATTHLARMQRTQHGTVEVEGGYELKIGKRRISIEKSAYQPLEQITESASEEARRNKARLEIARRLGVDPAQLKNLGQGGMKWAFVIELGGKKYVAKIYDPDLLRRNNHKAIESAAKKARERGGVTEARKILSQKMSQWDAELQTAATIQFEKAVAAMMKAKQIPYLDPLPSEELRRMGLKDVAFDLDEYGVVVQPFVEKGEKGVAAQFYQEHGDRIRSIDQQVYDLAYDRYGMERQVRRKVRKPDGSVEYESVKLGIDFTPQKDSHVAPLPSGEMGLIDW